jgi:uncharacterized lipoprotein YmbA
MLLFAAGLFLVLAGCAESVPPSNYIMTADSQRDPVRQASAADGPIVYIAPVRVPEYLNHNGIVTRDYGNEIRRADAHIWAGPLSDEIARAVSENLSALLPTDRTTLAESGGQIPVDYTVAIEIMSFELNSDTNMVDMVGRWILFRGEERRLLTMRRSEFHKQVAGADYRDTVAAMSEAVAALSDDIATAISQSRERRKSDRWATRRAQGSSSGEATARRTR